MTVPNTIYIVLNSLSILIAVIAIIGNALVCHVIVRLKTMKTSIDYIILNLAILDAISGIMTIYYVFVDDHRGVLVEPVLERAYNQSSVLALVMCKIEIYYWFPGSISPLLLVIMAYERYKAIADPLSRLDGNVTKARLKWMLPLAWMTGLCYCFPIIGVVRYDKNQGHCNFKWKYADIYATSWLTTQYIIPSTAMVVLYGRVIASLRKQNYTLGAQVEAVKGRRRAKKKVMRTIIAVTLVFYFSCGIPLIVFVLASSFFIETIKFTLWEDTLGVLLSVNFAFNPCAYFLFIQSFRDGFCRLFQPQREITSRSRILPSVQSNFRQAVDAQVKNDRVAEAPVPAFNVCQSESEY